MSYTVYLTGSEENKKVAINLYGVNYFPRKLYYRKDADALVARLSRRYVRANCKPTKEYEQQVTD